MKTNFARKNSPFLLGIALSAGIALIPNAAFAVDAVGGSATFTNTTVNSSVAWTVLRTVNFQNPSQRYCTATGSADAFNPGYPTFPASLPSQYLFTVSNSLNPPVNQGQERTLEFWNQLGAKDNQIKEITTTGGWMANLQTDPGYFTFPGVVALFSGQKVYFLARKVSANTPNLTVLDSSLSVTCTDSRLVPPIGIIQPL